MVQIYCHKRRFILNIKRENVSLARKSVYERQINELVSIADSEQVDYDFLGRNENIEQQIMAWNLKKWKRTDAKLLTVICGYFVVLHILRLDRIFDNPIAYQLN